MIDNYVKHAQSLIKTFELQDKAPHIAISVDMLDTGIDVPAVANLVFFKPVFSKIKFWQMIGRGTRPCPDLFGPGQDKPDFRVFDFCFNFDFFQENPEGINAGDTAPLGTRLFQARVQLLSHIQSCPETDPDVQLATSLTDGLYREDLQGLENVLTEIGADEGEILLSDLLKRNETPSLAHFIRSLVGLDRAAAKTAFARFLNDSSLTAPQIRFIELIIDQLTARGIMDAEALYNPPFTNLHSGGPDVLFAGKENLIEAVFTTLKSLEPRVEKKIQEMARERVG
ncbi:Helicase conserved C-terminal domain-containing protein [Candidatus Electrothrix aarhusensis]|uniref:Helicase conserved C-terminal domain-containing protein n=1 Tax=Candidatus Electrothrix aarhusensis TaxID=1859131 RepID=A0A3S3U867_9BACT|nr:Helicase conserved C-terminal domain-containing protein [Candidatus Electrothrix aarhusensis]